METMTRFWTHSRLAIGRRRKIGRQKIGLVKIGLVRICLAEICLILFSSSLCVLPTLSSESMPKKNGGVLPADKFVGRAQVGYKAAAQAPELCAKLFCYCGCDVTDKHHSLLDCYITDHSVDCQICQDEAIMAVHMLKEGKSVAQIQKTIDNSFGGQYPWSKPTEQLLEYQKSLAPGKEIKSESDAAKKDNSPNQLKPGAKMSNCCGGH